MNAVTPAKFVGGGGGYMNFTQGRRKHAKTGGGTKFQGHFWVVKRALKFGWENGKADCQSRVL